MTKMTKKEACELLTEALNTVTEGHYGTPSVKGPADGWDDWTVCWDGPFDWTMITAGSSVFAGESGRYSTPLESAIADALKTIENAGMFFEAINNTWITPCKL